MTSPRTPDEEARWQAARLATLRRAGFRCADCGRGDDGTLHVHHVVPRDLGGMDDLANLVVLCPGCHAARHPRLHMRLAGSRMWGWALRLARALDRDGEIPDGLAAIEPALQALGISQLREGQLDIILAALRGESLLAVRPTGSGKSLCFQTPTLAVSGTSYVVTPLSALMRDQVSQLTRKKVPAAAISSQNGAEEKRLAYRALADGALKFLYLSPERFDPAVIGDPTEIDRLAAQRPAFLVIDEAHCVDRWGGDFRPSYARLAEVRQRLGDPPVLAFTATAGAEMQGRILQSLGVPDARVFLADVDRPNIALVRARWRIEGERLDQLERLVRHRPRGRTMIFVATIRHGEDVQGALAGRGLEIPFYHGQLEARERMWIEDRFTGRVEPLADVVICTNAFGMGLDVPDVRLVVHWSLPESPEDYLQEVGRAGRDGQRSIAVLFVEEQEGGGIRRWMAQKGREDRLRRGDHVGDVEAAFALRMQGIDALERMARDQRACFRKGLLAWFGAERTPRASLAMRLLRWLYEGRQRTVRAGMCCDACDRAKAEAYLRGGRFPRR